MVCEMATVAGIAASHPDQGCAAGVGHSKNLGCSKGANPRMKSYHPWDGVSPGIRKSMQGNKAKDTKPEIAVRRVLHRLGYRFRLHSKDLPGRPDLVFGRRRKVVEVRGCYWHGHGCKIGQPALSNTAYWGPKIARNKLRDAANLKALRESGWDVFEVWECRLQLHPAEVEIDLAAFLGPPRMAQN